MSLSLLARISSFKSIPRKLSACHRLPVSASRSPRTDFRKQKWLEISSARFSVSALLLPQTLAVRALHTMDPSPVAVEDVESPETHQKLIAKLESAGISITKSHHEAVKTSEEAAKIRGFSLASGAKAIVMSVKVKSPEGEKATFALFVMSATHKLESKKAKKLIAGCKSMSFATPEQVKSLTGCIPGAVPPFGSLWSIQTYMDPSLRSVGEYINFNAGLRTDSVRMLQQDYEKVEEPIVAEFATSTSE